MADGTLRYSIENMRVMFPEGKTAQNNPDRFATVSGKFYNVDAKGNRKDSLAIASKAISKETATNPLTVIDLENGILVLPEGRRGRSKTESVSNDTLANALAALRGNS